MLKPFNLFIETVIRYLNAFLIRQNRAEVPKCSTETPGCGERHRALRYMSLATELILLF